MLRLLLRYHMFLWQSLFLMGVVIPGEAMVLTQPDAREQAVVLPQPDAREQAVVLPQPDAREQAVAWFQSGQFDRALPVFAKLAYDFPYDYMVKYYLGATMVETGDFGVEAEKNLVLAMPRDVPPKVYYYLGVLSHARNNWNSAQRYYNRFRNNADSVQVRELEVARLTELCFAQVNPFVDERLKVSPEASAQAEAQTPPPETSVQQAETLSPPETSVQQAETLSPPERTVQEAETLSPPETSVQQAETLSPPERTVQEPKIPSPPETSVQGVTEQISAGTSLDPVKEALSQEESATNVVLTGNDPGTIALPGVEGDSLQVTEEVIPEGERAEPGPVAGAPLSSGGESAKEFPRFIHFQVTEKVTYLAEWMFQVPEALQAFREAEASQQKLDLLLRDTDHLRKAYHLHAHPATRDSLARLIGQAERETILLKGEMDGRFRKAAALEQAWWQDAGYEVYERFSRIRDSLLALQDPPRPVIPDLGPEVFLEAAGTTSTVTAIGTSDEKEKAPDENQLVYRIQLGAYPKAVPASRKALFDKISKIRVIDTYINEKGATVYTTGSLTNYSDALKLMEQVRLEGVKDAFVIALQNGKRVSLPKQ
ncbi:MAG TPA: hypothetical protein PK489_00710 [Prolixibacteraceae bacterium]|nr:hypothetical protein [Prolixibacteraceae bacterium]